MSTSLTRRVDGDIVVQIKGDGEYHVECMAICGSKEIKAVHSILRDTMYAKTKPYRMFRSNATKIDDEADFGDEWTFGVPYISVESAMEKFLEAFAKTYKSTNTKQIVVEDAMQILADRTQPLTESFDLLAKKYHELNFKYEEFSSSNNAMEIFPFHLYLSPRFLRKYKYDWVPFDFPTSLVKRIPNLPVSFYSLDEAQIRDDINQKEGAGKLLILMKRRLAFVKPKLPQFEMNVKEITECTFCGTSWNKNKRSLFAVFESCVLFIEMPKGGLERS
ncbi:hypothetical protein HK098_000547 [Nowakowskiella sp. JEL0407]|nr:hypothetical protein HK098_000547 [Nowakowskiella sp. JEL0407]